MALSSSARAQEVVRPIVASEFGKQITVKAEFVAKSNDYYSQNLVAEPYTLKVIAVNGKTMKEPIFIEYKLRVDEKARAKIERLGVITTFEAYESLYQPASSTPWLGEGEQGTSFALIHVLHIRPTIENG